MFVVLQTPLWKAVFPLLFHLSAELDLRLAKSTEASSEFARKVVEHGPGGISKKRRWEFGTAVMNHSDWLGLHRNEKFTDEPINGYLSLMASEAALMGMIVIGSLVVWNEHGTSPLFRNNERGRCNILSKQMKLVGIDPAAATGLMFPLHIPGTDGVDAHWVLLVLDFREKMWTGYDSAGYDCEPLALSLNELIKQQLEGAEIKIGGEFTYQKGNTPAQAGGTECGAYTCMSALCIIRNLQFPPYATTDPERFAVDARCYIAETAFLLSVDLLPQHDTGECPFCSCKHPSAGMPQTTCRIASETNQSEEAPPTGQSVWFTSSEVRSASYVPFDELYYVPGSSEHHHHHHTRAATTCAPAVCTQ